MEEFCMVLTTLNDSNGAQKLAASLVENKLAACVHVMPMGKSVYFWDSKIQKDDEMQLLIKTGKHKLAEMEAFFADHHPYDVPEFVIIDSDASKDYLDWVKGCL